jgi:MYXO-CTERM domain-containing protein
MQREANHHRERREQTCLIDPRRYSGVNALAPRHFAALLATQMLSLHRRSARSLTVGWVLAFSLVSPAFAQKLYRINTGGPAAGSFAADVFFDGGAEYATDSGVDLSGVIDPAPLIAYQSYRYAYYADQPIGAFRYTFHELDPGSRYLVRLHFAEVYIWTDAGERLFDVAINGIPSLVNFDVLREAGGPNRALVREFIAVASDGGTIDLDYSAITDRDSAMSAAIEILPFDGGISPAPPIPVRLRVGCDCSTGAAELGFAGTVVLALGLWRRQRT